MPLRKRFRDCARHAPPAQRTTLATLVPPRFVRDQWDTRAGATPQTIRQLGGRSRRIMGMEISYLVRCGDLGFGLVLLPPNTARSAHPYVLVVLPGVLHLLFQAS